MEFCPDLYQDAACTYIVMIKKDNFEVGVTIEQIHASFGARAALLTTLIITTLRLEMKEDYRRPDRSIYALISKDYQEALPLVDHAIARCCAAWGIPDVAVIYLRPVDPAQAAKSAFSHPTGFSPDLPN